VKNNKPLKISIIKNYFNDEKYLNKYLKSILNQIYNIELLTTIFKRI